MVKEFEMKKSAEAYSRASVSRTGVLDTAKLHTYKYNEDLFKRVTIVNDGKSHGLVFNIDWSGSMHSSLLATVKQLITLITFCRKVNIAYDVTSLLTTIFVLTITFALTLRTLTISMGNFVLIVSTWSIFCLAELTIVYTRSRSRICLSPLVLL